ncbi:permease [Bacillus seohaeanensis]|uniref:Permease n=1 Tax=Bacillus seohaeanensis TaxID=284580 RepID=A0ABW5RPF9_9BACI
MGILFTLLGGFYVFVAMMAQDKPTSSVYITGSMAVMSFCLSYLSPQFKQKDERMKLIRQKGMFFSYFAILSYYIIFSTLLQFEIISITALELVNILIALTISTVFLSFVIVSKRY